MEQKPPIDKLHPKVLDEHFYRKLDFSLDHPLVRSIQALTCAEIAFDQKPDRCDGIPVRDHGSGVKRGSHRYIGFDEGKMDIAAMHRLPQIISFNSSSEMICLPSSIFTSNKSWENVGLLKDVIRESLFPDLNHIEVIPKQVIIRRPADNPMSIYHALNATGFDNEAIVGKVLILFKKWDHCNYKGGYFEFQYNNKTIRFGDIKQPCYQDEQLDINDTIDNRQKAWVAVPMDKLTTMQIYPIMSGEQYLLHCDIITPQVDSPSGVEHGRSPLPPGFLKDHEEHQSYCPPPMVKDYSDDRRYPKQLPHNIPRVLEELRNSLSGSNCMAIPCFDFNNAKTIKAEHMKDIDRQLLLSILATNEYEVGLTTALIDVQTDIDDETLWEMVSYKVHTTGGPIRTAYIGCKQLPTGEMQVFTKSINKSHPINRAKTTLVTTQKEGHHVVLHRKIYAHEYDRNPSIYRYLENIMIICRKK